MLSKVTDSIKEKNKIIDCRRIKCEGQYALRRKSHHQNLRSSNQRLLKRSFIINSDVYIDELYFNDIHFSDVFSR
jgi:hypothetical protein